MTSSFGVMLAFGLASSTLMMLPASCCLPPRGSCLVLLQPLHIMSGNRMLLPLCTFVAAVANVNMLCQGKRERAMRGQQQQEQHTLVDIKSRNSCSCCRQQQTMKACTYAPVCVYVCVCMCASALNVPNNGHMLPHVSSSGH